MLRNRNIRTLILHIVVVVFVAGILFIPQIEESDAAVTLTATGTVKAKYGVYLRGGASWESTKLMLVRAGTKVTIKKEIYATKSSTRLTDRWYYVQVGGRHGYIRNDYITNISYNCFQKAWVKSNANYRIGAGTDMRRAGSLNKNAQFTVVLQAKPYGSTTTWYRARIGSSFYYISGKLITYTKPTVSTTTQPTVKPTTKPATTTTASGGQSAAAKKVAMDSYRWAMRIANDNTFHYGNGPHAHHEGCYFCGTQPSSKRKYVVQWQKTYCCNPFVHAAYAHGGKVPSMLKRCKQANSYMEAQYRKSKLFKNLGKPNRKTLMIGDVICCHNGHVMMYAGNGTIVESSNGDDGKPGSSIWKKSISVRKLTDDRWNNKRYGVTGVYRYIGE